MRENMRGFRDFRLVGVLSVLLTTSLGAADEMKEYTVQLQAGDDALSGAFCVGVVGDAGSRIVVGLEGGGQEALNVRAEASVETIGFDGGKKKEMPDAVVNVAGVRYFTRPRLRRYEIRQRHPCQKDKLQQDLIANAESFPAASQTFITFEVRQDDDGFAIFLDGQYIGRRDHEAKIESLTFHLPATGAVRDLKSFRRFGDARFHPLDVSKVARPGLPSGTTVSLEPGRQTVKGIPLIVADAARSADIGVVKQMKGSWALEVDEYLARTALDGMPESVHFAVPQAMYTRAYALCAVEPDKDEDPIITARLTRFASSGRGGAIADTTLTLPRADEPLPDGVTQVGTVSYRQDGNSVELPLLLVEFVLKPGDILDLLSMESDPHASMMREPYLDFEFVGKLGRVTAQWDGRHKPDNDSTSAVHVFAATLERSPVELRLAQAQPGNIFHNDEAPMMTATLGAKRPCEVTLAWTVSGVAGEVLKKEARRIVLNEKGEQQDTEIDLGMGDLGWYRLEFRLSDREGRELLKHDAAFALLGTDTRRAGYDSPYGTWWFAGAHYGASDKDVAGPMLFKAGLRKTTFGWSKYTEADMAPWKITLNQISSRVAPRDEDHKEAAYAEAEAKVKELRERFPHCRSALIFHESYAHYIPAELRDEKPVEDEATIEREKALVKRGTFAAEFYREKFPDIKRVVGNTSSSVSIIAVLLRNGFDPKYIDTIGVEAVGQTCMPEKLWEGGTEGIWLAREAGRKFGYDLPVTGCYEFTARTDRNLGPERDAEWIVRDMLLCLAYRFDRINPAILHDTGNAYFNTLWGAGGLCERNPLLYPKPAYVGVATLTKVLDQVTLRERVPTGSKTVYALDFDRADGKRALALWTARGSATLRLDFPKRSAMQLVSFFGNPERVVPSLFRKALNVKCGTAPVYLVGDVGVDSIRVLSRSFAPPPASFVVADAMDDIARWQLRSGDVSLDNPHGRSLPIYVAGDFDFRQVDDEEKGRCLELELNRKGSRPDIVSEYAVIKLRQAVAVPGRPDRIGLWVKGDSGWGKIIFEIQDRAGALWRTEGAYHDWPGDLSICHDGWRYMDFPIDGSSTERNISAGRRWNSNSGQRDARIEFPIKIVGLYVAMNRKALDLTEMKEVPGVLRFRDLGTSGSGEPGGQPAAEAREGGVPADRAVNAAAGLYWHEDFSRFDVGPAGGFGAECVICEKGGPKYLHGTGWMMGNMNYFGANRWHDYSFRFRFRFTDPEKIGFYPLVKSRGRRGDAAYLWYYVNVSRDKISFTCHGLAKELAEGAKTPEFMLADAGLAPLKAEKWYTLEIRVTNDEIGVRLAEDGGEMKQVASIETFPGDGGVDILSYNPVDIADMTVERLTE